MVEKRAEKRYPKKKKKLNEVKHHFCSTGHTGLEKDEAPRTGCSIIKNWSFQLSKEETHQKNPTTQDRGKNKWTEKKPFPKHRGSGKTERKRFMIMFKLKEEGNNYSDQSEKSGEKLRHDQRDCGEGNIREFNRKNPQGKTTHQQKRSPKTKEGGGWWKKQLVGWYRKMKKTVKSAKWGDPATQPHLWKESESKSLQDHQAPGCLQGDTRGSR